MYTSGIPAAIRTYHLAFYCRSRPGVIPEIESFEEEELTNARLMVEQEAEENEVSPVVVSPVVCLWPPTMINNRETRVFFFGAWMVDVQDRVWNST